MEDAAPASEVGLKSQVETTAMHLSAEVGISVLISEGSLPVLLLTAAGAAVETWGGALMNCRIKSILFCFQLQRLGDLRAPPRRLGLCLIGKEDYNLGCNSIFVSKFK